MKVTRQNDPAITSKKKTPIFCLSPVVPGIAKNLSIISLWPVMTCAYQGVKNVYFTDKRYFENKNIKDTMSGPPVILTF